MNINDILMQALERQKAGQLAHAKLLYGQVLQAAPLNHDAHHLLGCIYAQERKMDEAIASIGTAIAISPKQPTFYNSLGTCYKDKSERVAAEMCFRHALLLDQNYADALSNLGGLLVNSQRHREALNVLQQAVTRIPDHEGILCNLAWAHLELAQLDDAFAVYRRAAESFPSSSMATMGMAVCLSKSNDAEGAIALADRVLAIGSRFQDSAFQIKAMALEALGRLDDARVCFDAALEINPGSSTLLLGRANLGKVKPEDPFFQLILSQEDAAQRLRGAYRTQMFYALGKVYQDVGDMASAARNYAIGASSQLLESHYEEKVDIDRDRGLQQCMTPSVLQAFKGAGNDTDRPIFILGMPRSGTTLIEQIIGTHSAVTPAGELTFINEVLDGFFLSSGCVLNFDTAHQLAREATLRQRADGYLAKVDAFAKTAVGRRFTDKMPSNYLHVGLISAMFPNARIIHCRRDPIDTCISCYNTLFADKQYWSYDLGALGRTYRRYWDLMQHWRDLLPGRILEMRYEQVIDNTEAAARTLLDWCGLEWEPQVLNFHETKRQVMTASVMQVRQPIYTSSIGRWKKWEPYIQPLLAEIHDVAQLYWAELGK